MAVRVAALPLAFAALPAFRRLPRRVSGAQTCSVLMSARGHHTKPAVGVSAAVVRKGPADNWEVLLAQRDREPAKGLWSLPGGKLELGETVADGTRREIKEETGIDVDVGMVFNAVDAIYYLPEDQSVVNFHYVVLNSFAKPADPAQIPKADDDVKRVEWVALESPDSVGELTAGLGATLLKCKRLLDSGWFE